MSDWLMNMCSMFSYDSTRNDSIRSEFSELYYNIVLKHVLGDRTVNTSRAFCNLRLQCIQNDYLGILI